MRKGNAAMWAAQQHRIRLAKALPLTEAEAQRLVAEAIERGRVTRCPTRCVAPVYNGEGL